MSSFWAQKAIDFEPTMKVWEEIFFKIPELGFKEVLTRKKVLELAHTFNLKITQDYGINGFSITIGEGYPHIGLMAEMDALVVPDHPNASEIDHAAHACGHHLQTVILLSTLSLYDKYRNRSLKGSVTFYFVAAEEYVDLQYRRSLKEKGSIKLFSGKQNLILEEAFKDIDVILSCHTMGKTSHPMIELNSKLSGFIHKTITFNGKSSHAAVAPHLGVNALNAMVLTQNAIALLRETFQEKDMIRVHLMNSLGGQSINAVPSKVILEGYVRSINPESLKRVNEAIDQAAIHCSQALGATCDIHDEPGYLPLIQSESLNEVLRPHALELVSQEGILDHQAGFASGDIGDVSLFIPTIQFGFSGCKGLVHGSDFYMDKSQEALVNPVILYLESIDDLLSNPVKVVEIKKSFVPTMNLVEYKKLHHID